MPRLMLSDELWSKLEKILFQQAIYHGPDLRMTVEACSTTWRDLPRAFGIWSSIFKRFNAWSAAGKWSRILKALIEEPDFEWVFIDGTYAKAPQHSAGARAGDVEAISASRAGRTSKIYLASDAQGLPVEFQITSGQIINCIAVPRLIEQLPAAKVIVADKGYNSERIRKPIEALGARPVIPRKRTSIKGNADMDKVLYRYLHLVDNAFARLKQYRAVAFRSLGASRQGVRTGVKPRVFRGQGPGDPSQLAGQDADHHIGVTAEL